MITKRNKGFYRSVACFLCIVILLQNITVYAIGDTNNTQAAKNPIASQVERGDVTEKKEQERRTEEQSIPESNNKSSLYENGAIKIYHEKQLKAIGTNLIVTDQDVDEISFGTGNAIVDGQGQAVRYGLDCKYKLMNDIELDSNSLWSIPEAFTGTFIGTPVDETMPLYEAATDTIYVYHNYQLLILNGGNGSNEPIMSQDMIPEKFGIGTLLYKNGKPIDDTTRAAQEYLTYAPTHRYVLSRNFTEHMPELQSTQFAVGTVTSDQLSGRAHVGQVYAEINQKKYILIGNEQQLRAIGTGKQVTPMLFVRISGALAKEQIIPYYPGDADFNIRALNQTNVDYKDIAKNDLNFQYFIQNKPADAENLMNADLQHPDNLLSGVTNVLGGLLSGLLGGLTVKKEIVGLKGENTNAPSIGAEIPAFSSNKPYQSITELKGIYDGLTYTSNQNYIIFRNIDLKAGTYSNQKDDDWKPMHFSGTMEGRLNMLEGSASTISNIHVNQTQPLDLEKDSGIGFFGSIQNEWDDTTLHSKGKVSVKNMTLQNISVKNNASTVDKTPQSLVDGLTSLLGGLLGTVVDGLLSVLGIPLGKIIEDLLTLKQQSPDLFATGIFAGRIVGDVEVTNCHVKDGTVSNVKDMTGGFVGYTKGETTYDGLSGILGALVKTLATLLNILPGVGLGDLITILLKNDVPLGNLIPTGYLRPNISQCTTQLQTGMIGSIATEYAGGFAGIQIGTVFHQCNVTNLVNVEAKNYAGGFSGLIREAQVMGLLNDLGVDLKTFLVRSEQNNCSVLGTNFTVSVQQQYAGGMNGAMANSYSTNCNVQGIQHIHANKYAGGFTGRATIGYGLSIGTEKDQKGTLLKAVSSLLTKLVAPGNEAKLETLLSISGAKPSRLENVTVTGTNWSVETTDCYAGGVIGQGDGVLIQSTQPGSQTNQVQGLGKVTAKSYAGGIGGSIVAANPIGVLNDTLGVGHYLPFKVVDTIVQGHELTVVSKQKYAAGGIGLMIGGLAEHVTINNVKEVKAGNYTGGFAGRAGSGGLLKEQGLDLLGLGLVKVDNVLSLIQAVRTKVNQVTVRGTAAGLKVCSDGTATLTDGEDILAGGFLSEAEGIEVKKSVVYQLKKVEAVKALNKESFAGGFIGRSNTGGLAGLAEKQDGVLKLPGIVTVTNLLNLVPYLVPSYTGCQTNWMSNTGMNGEELPQVTAEYAGGFAGELQSGIVDNTANPVIPAVIGIENVQGEKFAGGFAGKIHAGSLASSQGIGVLGTTIQLNITDLLSVLNVYIPKIKSANILSSERGLIVKATNQDSSAGGYVAHASGAQISESNVTKLRHTKVTPPSMLEDKDGSSYFGSQSTYAVTAGKYAGGYVGKADIGSAASVGGGLKLLNAINLTDILSAIDAVATKITNSDVEGQIGGFSILANGKDQTNAIIGRSGGFAGECSGSQIKDSDALNFAYIVGQEAAGGFVGYMEPGNVASIIEDTSVLSKLLNAKDNLASLINSFIPIIESCQATCVPCGGAVRAEGFTDKDYTRGLAGGYAGYNHGGRIRGTVRECATIRLRSVYGGEFAGGFTGLMETGNLTDTGNLNALFGLLSASNVLGLLGTVYPTEEHTAIYGPLRKLDVATWNAWNEAVGKNGVYGESIPNIQLTGQEAIDQATLDQVIKEYAYGYNVRAGRDIVGTEEDQAGVAGGYVGRMKGGVITDAYAWDTKDVQAYESAGGFAGEMITGGVANVGKLSLLGLPINGVLGAVETFVPVIRNSKTTGYQSGLIVTATGVQKQNANVEQVGYAGGYVGRMIGGQIWGNFKSLISTMAQTDAIPDLTNKRCSISNLRRVNGATSVGGFVGQVDPGSAAALDTASSSGLLGGLLQHLIGTPGDLLQVLNATVSTIRASDVKAWDPYGIIINGSYVTGNETSPVTHYAKSVGGFAGEINGAVLGELKDKESGNHVTDLRSVIGGEHVGGFFGLSDVSAVANVGKQGANASILQNLLKLGSADVLDTFRTYIYDSSVSGTATSGFEVVAYDSQKTGYINHPVYTGNAGGFGGTMLNGSVKRSQVIQIRHVKANNYSGGFVGHFGKSGVVDLDNLGIFDEVIGLGAGVMDIFGAHAEACIVRGVPEGFTVASENWTNQTEKEEIAGGFAGYADLAKLSNNKVEHLKQVKSAQIAGGFAGKTDFEYLANVKGNSKLVNKLLQLLNELLKKLWVADLQNGNLIHINLGLIKVDILYEGNLAHVNLLGLDLKIALAKQQQLATIYIGDSKIELNCASDGSITNLNDQALKDEINISLIKANRTTIKENTVTGIAIGYDVYGGGAGNQNNGSGPLGCAGGFIGYNREGLLKNNEMFLADVIRGTVGKTGPFVGTTTLDSGYSFNSAFGIEGTLNKYRVYRVADPSYVDLNGKRMTNLDETCTSQQGTNEYVIAHRTKNKVEEFADLKDAVLHSTDGLKKDILAEIYLEQGAMAKLMGNTPTEVTPENPKDQVPENMQDPCNVSADIHVHKEWKYDRASIRPQQIILNITRSYTDASGQVVVDPSFSVNEKLTVKDASSDKTWDKVLTGPEYKAYYVDQNGKHHYYTYAVTENNIDGYSPKITYQGKYQYDVTIVNEKNWFDQLLPHTGSWNRWILYTIGILLFILWCFSAKRKNQSQKVHLL